eukprot:GILI01020208.1.p1 GENE.GILI01020208.1~~GILI01020208.1.p1  ORF type:complete len:329 (+),score=48.78 GILI01020208.1:32-1018(+)
MSGLSERIAQLFQAVSAPSSKGAVIRFAGWDIGGRSIAGDHSCMILPALRLAFDIGGCISPESINMPTVCVTHGHIDHVGGIVAHAASRNLRKLDPPLYLVPSILVDPIAQVFDGFRKMDSSSLPYNIKPVSFDEQVNIKGGYYVKPFATHHRVPSCGFIVYSRRNKLKPEFVGSSKEETERLVKEGRAKGEDVICTIEFPEVAYTGDTLITGVLQHPDVVRANLLIMESTFVSSDRTLEDAHEYGHIHLDEIVEALRSGQLQNPHILLTHFSARYQAAQIVECLDEKLPQEFRGRVVPYLPGFYGFEKFLPSEKSNHGESKGCCASE